MRRIGIKDELFCMIGYTLVECKEYLAEKNILIHSIHKLSSPRQRDIEFSDNWRVVAIDIIQDGQVDITVCKPLGS